MVKLKESGIRSLFHQKVIAKYILIWKNPVIATQISNTRAINPAINVAVQSTIEYSKDASQYPMDGIMLSSLNDFMRECGGRSQLKDLTTTDVVKLFIKPKVSHSKSSYCEYLKTIDPRSVGEAQVYISYAWRYQFLEVLDTLQSHFESEPNVFIWIDIFSMSLFIDTTIYTEIDDLLWNIMSIIRKVKHTVFIFSPWNHAITAWIFHEILCTVLEMSKFEIAMSSTDKSLLMGIGARSTIESILQEIDCRNSAISDLTAMRILYIIDNTVGFDYMNKLVSERLMETLATFMEKEAEFKAGIVDETN